MYVLHNCLLHKNQGLNLEDRLEFFTDQNNVNVANLLWECGTRHIRGNPGMDLLEFRINNLFPNDMFGQINIDLVREGTSPFIEYGNDFVEIQIDHLLRDNDIVAELPVSLHRQKTDLIDDFIRKPQERLRRNPYNHWRARFNALGIE